MTVEKPKPKQLLRPITTGAGSAMNQSQFLTITCNSLEAREKSRVHGTIGFGFASHWLKNWRESLKPITNYFRQSFENCSILDPLCISGEPLRSERGTCSFNDLCLLFLDDDDTASSSEPVTQKYQRYIKMTLIFDAVISYFRQSFENCSNRASNYSDQSQQEHTAQ